MALYDAPAMVKTLAHFGLFCKSVKTLGTEKHHAILNEAAKLKFIGIYALTEFGHGSNVRGIETTATFDPDTDEFIINSPTETAAKFWIASLAKCGEISVVYAQLITQGVNHGVHAFLFRI